MNVEITQTDNQVMVTLEGRLDTDIIGVREETHSFFFNAGSRAYS